MEPVAYVFDPHDKSLDLAEEIERIMKELDAKKVPPARFFLVGDTLIDVEEKK